MKKSLSIFLLTAALCYAFAGAARADEVLTFAKRADVDGDGKIDNIKLLANDQSSKFELHINNATFRGETTDTPDGIQILSFTRRDKGIVVHATSPGGGEEFVLLRYENWKIRRLISGGGTIESAGRGTLRVESLNDGFWTRVDLLQWRRNQLIRVPQKLWTINIAATTKAPLTLRAAPYSTKTLATLPRGRKVILEKSNGNAWFLVRSQSGLRGWVSTQQVYNALEGILMSG